jgi:hypothetical protein
MSQTGTAVNIRYPEAVIRNCGDSVAAVRDQLDANSGPFSVPIWNSHQGEVQAARFVWDRIEAGGLFIRDLWAKRIEFWWLRRIGVELQHGRVGSVLVAQTQCSAFLKKNNLQLERCDLTTVAYEKYENGAAWDGVLVADGQRGDISKFEVVATETANPNNFTSFVTFEMTQNDRNLVPAPTTWLTGVTMRKFGVSMGDVEQSFFDQMLGTVHDVSDLPKLVFVFDRVAKVGLLFEGAQFGVADLLDAEELERGEIFIHESAGGMSQAYSHALRDLFLENFPALGGDDFIVHEGVNTCLFVCPPLGLYTHGFEILAVESAVRFYIGRVFELWENGVRCTDEQNLFFERYKTEWLERGSDFIQFSRVRATSIV